MTRTRLTALAVLALAALTTGCAAPAGKSGGRDADELELTAGGYLGSPTAQAAERFAGRVEALSKGSLRVQLVYRPAAASAIRSVRAGDAQLGIIPAEALGAAGVRTLAALQAPFLVASYAGAVRVTGGALASRLERGLDRVRLTGLGLVPEGMYRPFGFLKPLETPADFAGVTIRSSGSRAMGDLLRALGARPVALGSRVVDTAVRSGFGSDVGPLVTAAERFPENAYAAANVALFPKVDVLVASRGAFDGLSAAERTILRRAAAEARAETIAATDEQAAAAAFCRAGGTLVTAPGSALRALRAKVARQLAGLRGDPAVGALVAEIARLAGGSGRALEPCGPSSVAGGDGVAFDKVPFDERLRLVPANGSYRRVLTASRLRAAGAGEADVRSNEGVATLTFSGSRGGEPLIVLAWQGPPARPPCRGRAGLIAGEVVVKWNPATPCNSLLAFRWRLAGRDVVIASFGPGARPAWLRSAYLGTWRRVDCAIPADGPAPSSGGGRARRC